MDHLLTRPVVITPKDPASGVDDAWGNEVTAVGDPVEAFAYLEQTDATEVSDGGATYVSRWKIALAAGSRLEAWDEVQVPDMGAAGRFHVVGRPARPWRPSTGEHHIEARLVEVT